MIDKLGMLKCRYCLPKRLTKSSILLVVNGANCYTLFLSEKKCTIMKVITSWNGGLPQKKKNTEYISFGLLQANSKTNIIIKYPKKGKLFNVIIQWLNFSQVCACSYLERDLMYQLRRSRHPQSWPVIWTSGGFSCKIVYDYKPVGQIHSLYIRVWQWTIEHHFWNLSKESLDLENIWFSLKNNICW